MIAVQQHHPGSVSFPIHIMHTRRAFLLCRLEQNTRSEIGWKLSQHGDKLKSIQDPKTEMHLPKSKGSPKSLGKAKTSQGSKITDGPELVPKRSRIVWVCPKSLKKRQMRRKRGEKEKEREIVAFFSFVCLSLLQQEPPCKTQGEAQAAERGDTGPRRKNHDVWEDHAHRAERNKPHRTEIRRTGPKRKATQGLRESGAQGQRGGKET